MRLPVLFSTTVMSTALVAAYAAELPTGGAIVAGSGSISQNGTAMTITQDTAKMVANWDSFSIGQGHSVHFQQPSADAVALNRVLGSDVSVIQGALTANGKIFLVNPNGVMFTPSAQVNTGSLVASTQAIKTEDFLSGNYAFEGTSSNAITNKGNIAVSKGGSVALIAAKIINEGTIEAEGGNVLLGAGNKVTLDLGGPVKLVVDEGALETLIEQGGAIKANGGIVYLTAKAAGALATSVINHSGITEAQTLTTGEKGQILLMGDMTQGVVNVAGKLDASAPAAGDGGFVETSAAHVQVANGTQVTTKATHGKDGLWLIDPNDYTVAASGGNITGATLSSNLGSGNVQIQTTGSGGNLIVNDAVSWAANTLTLTAHNNIQINANLTATGTGGLAFEYGQQTTDGAGSSYSVANGVKVLIPAADKFTWKKGSAGATNNLWFGNDVLKIDSNRAAALNANGALLQPFYYDDGTQSRAAGWYKLTFSNYPLDFAVGTGGTGTNSWNANGQILSTNGSGATDISNAINTLSIDISKYQEGLGTLTSRLNVNVAETGDTLDIVNSYTLEAGKNFIKTETTLENKSASAGLTNVRLWVGTRDDYVGQSDSNYKTKGNITSDGFEEIASQSEQSKAVKITEQIDGTGAAILFYSTSAGADTVTDRCCSFNNVVSKDPRTSSIVTPREDGSYALFLRMNDLAAGQNQSLIWYYGAGQANQIESIITQVGQSAGTIPSAPSTPAQTPEVPKVNAIAAAQATASTASANTTARTTNTPAVQVASRNVSTAPSQGGQRTDIRVGSMDVVQVTSAEMARQEGAGGRTSNGTAEQGSSGEANSAAGVTTRSDIFGPTKVFVVDGGVKIPGQNDTNEQ